MPSTSPQATPAELARARVADRVRGQLMQAALKELLDQVRGARAALPHLAALEDALGRRGAAAVAEVPPQWLGRIITQLSGLPLRDDDPELQDLLSRLCTALGRHQQPTAPAPQEDAHPSDFHDPVCLEVREISHSAFADEFPTQAGRHRVTLPGTPPT